MLRPLYLLERPGSHFIGGLRVGLDKCGKSLPTGIRSPDSPARSYSLYRLTCPSSKPLMLLTIVLNMEYMKMVVDLLVYENLSRVSLRQNTSMEFCLEVMPIVKQ